MKHRYLSFKSTVLIAVMAILSSSYLTQAQITGDVPASKGDLTWDIGFFRVSAQKFGGLELNPSRGAGVIAVPTAKSPTRNLDELAAGVVVGGFYLPVANVYWRLLVKSPSVFTVRLSRRDGNWVADLVQGSRVFATVPATVETGLSFSVQEPIAIIGGGSSICYVWDSIRVCI